MATCLPSGLIVAVELRLLVAAEPALLLLDAELAGWILAASEENAVVCDWFDDILVDGLKSEGSSLLGILLASFISAREGMVNLDMTVLNSERSFQHSTFRIKREKEPSREY